MDAIATAIFKEGIQTYNIRLVLKCNKVLKYLQYELWEDSGYINYPMATNLENKDRRSPTLSGYDATFHSVLICKKILMVLLYKVLFENPRQQHLFKHTEDKLERFQSFGSQMSSQASVILKRHPPRDR